MEKRTQKHCPALRMPRRDLKSYTVDDIEELIAFYLGVKTAPEPHGFPCEMAIVVKFQS